MTHSTFIYFANQEDDCGTRLDPFLDWLEAEGEFLAGDKTTRATYDRKRAEYAS